MVEEVISTDPRADRTVLFLQEISNIILKLVKKINLQKMRKFNSPSRDLMGKFIKNDMMQFLIKGSFKIILNIEI